MISNCLRKIYSNIHNQIYALHAIEFGGRGRDKRPPAFGNGGGVDFVAVILRGHEAAPGVRVHARLVMPAISVRQLPGLAPHSLC